MSLKIKGEAGNVIAMTISVAAGSLDLTTVTTASMRATDPDGEFVAWASDIESATATEIVIVHAFAAQLAAGVWRARPFLYVGGVLVTSLDLDSVVLRVVPDPVPAP